MSSCPPRVLLNSFLVVVGLFSIFAGCLMYVRRDIYSTMPIQHLTLYEFESASDCECAMSNIAPHVRCDIHVHDIHSNMHHPFSHFDT